MATPPAWQLTEPAYETQEPMFAESTSADREYESSQEQPHSAQTTAAAPQPPAILTADEFAGLEERILRAVSLVRSERQARTAAEERAAALAAELLHAQSQTAQVEQMQQEIASLRAERDQVRQRVDRLLSQLDALEL